MIEDDYLLMYLTDFLSVSSFCKLTQTCNRFQTPLVIEYLKKRICRQYRIVINENLLKPTVIHSQWSLECELPIPVPYDKLEQLEIITPRWNFDAYIGNTSYIWYFEKEGEHYIRTLKEQKIYIWLDMNGKYEICRIRFSYSPPIYKNAKIAKYMIYTALSVHYCSFWDKFEFEGHLCMIWAFILTEAFFFMETKQQKLYRVINATRRD